jgi:hypothetical protein
MATAMSRIWGESPQRSEGEDRGKRRGDGAFHAKAEPVVVMVVAEGLSSGLFIGRRGRFTEEISLACGACVVRLRRGVDGECGGDKDGVEGNKRGSMWQNRPN